jgi:hypothetical protein
MIQRIQTVYLLAALGLIICCFFFPLASLAGPDSSLFTVTLQKLSLLHLEGIVGILLQIAQITTVVMAVLVATTIFLYRNRMLQKRLCSIAVFVLIFLNGLVFFSLLYAKNSLSYTATYNLTAIFPMICAILVYMAERRIKKDEDLVRSLDRIR